MFEFWIDRLASKGSIVNYDELWYSYFAGQAGFDYVFPMCVVSTVDEIIELIDMSGNTYLSDRNIIIHAPLPNIHVRNNIITANVWHNATSGVLDLTLSNDSLPAYFSVFICLRDVDTSFTIRTPEQILAHYIVWISDDKQQSEITSVKATEGCALMVYKRVDTININVSIHQGSFIAKYIHKIKNKIIQSSIPPENIIEEILFKYYFEWIRYGTTVEHYFINPFYVAITEHYTNRQTNISFSITNIDNDAENIYQTVAGQKTMMINLTTEFIENRLLDVSPATMSILTAWPTHTSRNRETLIMYHLYNKPYSVLYTTNYANKDINLLTDNRLFIRNDNDILESTFDIFNVNLPTDNSTVHETYLGSSHFGTAHFYSELIIDTGTSIKKTTLQYVNLNTSINVYSVETGNDNVKEVYLAYDYDVVKLNNGRIIPYSTFTLLMVQHNTLTGTSNLLNNVNVPDDVGAITGFRFYAGYPIITMCRRRTDPLDIALKINIQTSLFRYYHNVLYPVGRVTTDNSHDHQRY